LVHCRLQLSVECIGKVEYLILHIMRQEYVTRQSGAPAAALASGVSPLQPLLRFKLDEAIDQIVGKPFYGSMILSQQSGASFVFVPVMGVDDLIAPESDQITAA
jgi:hypothetical protein